MAYLPLTTSAVLSALGITPAQLAALQALVPINTTPVTGYKPQVSLLPNVLYTLDAAQPTTTSALVAGTPDIQLDANNNVLGMVDSTSGLVLEHNYGEITYVPATTSSKALFRGNSASFNTAYDSFTFPVSAAGALVTPYGAAWGAQFVMKQTGTGANTLFRIYASQGNVNILPVSGATDGAYHIEQNNGHAYGDEPSSAATALNQLQVITFLCDGSTLSSYRNGTRTFQTPAGSIGGLTGITAFVILDNPQADVYFGQIFSGAPSVTQLNAELQRLATYYSVSNPGTLTLGPSAPIAPSVIDYTQYWLTTPNYPASDNLPTETTPSLHDGLVLASGATSLAAMTFTPGGTTATRTALDAQVYYNPFTGNQDTVTGGDGIEGVTTCYARVRRYAAGSTYDLHTFDANGLSLNCVASLNNTTAGCTNGTMYGGMIRLPTKILPGMVVSVVYRMPTSNIAWCPVWLFEGTQSTPGPGGNPYSGFNTSSALIQGEGNNNIYYEYDLNDGFWRPGFTNGTQFNSSFVNEKSTTFTTQPYDVFCGGGPEFAFQKNQNPPFVQLVNGGNMSTSFNRLVMNWRNDGSNIVDMLFNGKVLRQQYWPYNPSTYTDASGVTHQIAMHLLINNQCIPQFLPAANKTNIVPQDGGAIAGGPWSVTVQEIKIIKGNLTPACIAAATTDSNAV